MYVKFRKNGTDEPISKARTREADTEWVDGPRVEEGG